MKSRLPAKLPSCTAVAPELARFAEVVRGNSRNLHRQQIFVEVKRFGMRPYVRAVEVHIDRQISQQFNALFIALSAHAP